MSEVGGTTGAFDEVESSPAKLRGGTRVSIPLLWALGIGLASGAACVGVRLFFRMLQWLLVRHSGLLPTAAAGLPLPVRFLVPIVGALLATIVLWLARHQGRARYEGYIEAVRSDGGRIPFASTAWRTVSSAFSVATGAAIGREGSMIQFAAAVASWVGARWETPSLSLSRKVACGVAAAVAAAYKAPFAAIFFAYEIVFDEWEWSMAPALAVSAAAGWLVSRLLQGGGPLFEVPGTVSFAGVGWTIPLVILLVALAPAYQAGLRSLEFLQRLLLPLVWGGVAVGLLGLLHPTVWGNGDVALTSTLTAVPVMLSVLAVLLLRLAATTVCVGAGTVGGVFTPTVFTGAALGLVCAHLFHVANPVLLVVVGLGAFLAAVTHAPWMSSLMAVELTGQWHLLPLVLVLNLLASYCSHRISTHSLYDLATPEPTGPSPFHVSNTFHISNNQRSDTRESIPCTQRTANRLHHS